MFLDQTRSLLFPSPLQRLIIRHGTTHAFDHQTRQRRRGVAPILDVSYFVETKRLEFLQRQVHRVIHQSHVVTARARRVHLSQRFKLR